MAYGRQPDYAEHRELSQPSLATVALSHVDCDSLAQLSVIMQTIIMDREHFSDKGNSGTFVVPAAGPKEDHT